MEAYRKVKENDGAAGVDNETIADFEKNLKDNLYKIWNRMSSGTYFPPPVKAVPIPKKSGGERILGVPTVADRIAQMVVKMELEPFLEPVFHEDSYGYRPGRSAQQALAVTRERCWKYDWVLEFDIRGLFDNINHELLLKALKKHTDSKWILLYIERWLTASMEMPDGTQVVRTKGTPQGGIVSPILSNLFMHYVFDAWMSRNHPYIPFVRYADDGLLHCVSEKQARYLKRKLEARLNECGLELHPLKTKIVYCKDELRKKTHDNTAFDFLGYTFRPRRSYSKKNNKYFVNFSPGVSRAAQKHLRDTIRSWKIRLRADKSLTDIANMFNPVIQGWMNYFGKFYPSAMYPALRHINRVLVKWAKGKYKRLRRHTTRAEHWLGQIARKNPRLFAHWKLGLLPTAG
jgi:RNA-directed DNA polymerase